MAQELIIQGRIVWGHPTKLNAKKDRKTKQVVIGKDGQPIMQAAFGVAVDRNTFYQQVLPMMLAEARTAFPQANYDGTNFVGVSPKFSWKYKDGNTAVDDKGVPYRNREGYADHCVISISTNSFTPQIYKPDGRGGWTQMRQDEIKCGDFVGVKLVVKFNGQTGGDSTPGLYMNPQGLYFIGYGQEIVSSGADPDEMFAGFQPQQFAGMSAQPVMSAAPLPTGMAPTTPAMPQYAAAPQPTAPLPPPAHDFVNAAMGKAPPAAPAGYPGAPVGR